ncbi:hypothetical protein FTUN_8005 [Frigoriglobus tundricola]|uniref:Uncharacterized protein n=1 Tax=Frigoriglobus tundricola TaxID=2774151 RepID=A0A6M5Z2S8_9BACT|nr:hypothetical protein FTUN_8005 [Frigoriglobus tundricola]
MFRDRFPASKTLVLRDGLQATYRRTGRVSTDSARTRMRNRHL